MENIAPIDPLLLLSRGGALIVPIIICSFLSLAIIIEKFIYFLSIRTDPYELKKKIFDLIIDNKVKEAVALCDSNRSPLAKVLRAGIIKFGSSREEIKESMEAASLYEIPKLETRLNALSTIAHISPLLGLMGTVFGMIKCFYVIEVRAASLNPVSTADLASGIWEALIATSAGLLVAIPSYLAYNYFVSRINYYVLEMERGATELTNLSAQAA